MSTDDDITALREALAAGPAPGPWHKAEYLGGSSTVTTKADRSRGGDLFEWTSRANASYIAAASPDRITRLLDRIEALQAEVERLQSAFNDGHEAALRLVREAIADAGDLRNEALEEAAQLCEKRERRSATRSAAACYRLCANDIRWLKRSANRSPYSDTLSEYGVIPECDASSAGVKQ